MEHDEPISAQMRVQAQQRKDAFVSEVFYIADADERATQCAGWGIKGKVAWLQSAVASYRKDLHKILKD